MSLAKEFTYLHIEMKFIIIISFRRHDVQLPTPPKILNLSISTVKKADGQKFER